MPQAGLASVSEDIYTLLKAALILLRFITTLCTALEFYYILLQIALVKIVPVA